MRINSHLLIKILFLFILPLFLFKKIPSITISRFFLQKKTPNFKKENREEVFRNGLSKLENKDERINHLLKEELKIIRNNQIDSPRNKDSDKRENVEIEKKGLGRSNNCPRRQYYCQKEEKCIDLDNFFKDIDYQKKQKLLFAIKERCDIGN